MSLLRVSCIIRKKKGSVLYLLFKGAARFCARLDNSCALSRLRQRQKRIRFASHGLRCGRVSKRHVALWLQGVSSNKKKEQREKERKIATTLTRLAFGKGRDNRIDAVVPSVPGLRLTPSSFPNYRGERGVLL